MPKDRHFTFGDMQAQKAREQNLAKLRAMMKPAEAAAPEPGQSDDAEPATTSASTGKTSPPRPAPNAGQKKPSQVKASSAKKAVLKKASETKSMPKKKSAKK